MSGGRARLAAVVAALLAVLLAALLPAKARAGDFDERPEVNAFIAEMAERHGFDAAALTATFHQASLLPAVIKAILPPSAPGVRSWRAYRGRFVEAKRIGRGLRFWQDNAAALAAASQRYGVPEEIIVAIIGIETLYGRNTGRFQTFSALATLAFDYPPRAALFRHELEELLLLAREEGRDPLDYRGSYAGAMGLGQFLPSSQRRYAVDFDGSGRIEPTGSPADAIGSVANFLHEHGWQTGQPIAVPVEADGERCAALVSTDLEPRQTPAELAECGLRAGAAAELPAALIELATPNEASEFRLGYRNFQVLSRYNHSSFYAMAVNDLAESLVAARRAPPGRGAHSRASRSRPSR